MVETNFHQPITTHSNRFGVFAGRFLVGAEYQVLLPTAPTRQSACRPPGNRLQTKKRAISENERPLFVIKTCGMARFRRALGVCRRNSADFVPNEPHLTRFQRAALSPRHPRRYRSEIKSNSATFSDWSVFGARKFTRCSQECDS